MLSFILEHYKMQFCPSLLFQIDLSNGADWTDIAHNNIIALPYFNCATKYRTIKC